MAWNLNKKDGFNLGVDQSGHQRATEFMNKSLKKTFAQKGLGKERKTERLSSQSNHPRDYIHGAVLITLH